MTKPTTYTTQTIQEIIENESVTKKASQFAADWTAELQALPQRVQQETENPSALEAERKADLARAQELLIGFINDYRRQCNMDELPLDQAYNETLLNNAKRLVQQNSAVSKNTDPERERRGRRLEGLIQKIEALSQPLSDTPDILLQTYRMQALKGMTQEARRQFVEPLSAAIKALEQRRSGTSWLIRTQPTAAEREQRKARAETLCAAKVLLHLLDPTRAISILNEQTSAFDAKAQKIEEEMKAVDQFTGDGSGFSTMLNAMITRYATQLQLNDVGACCKAANTGMLRAIQNVIGLIRMEISTAPISSPQAGKTLFC